jgi:hypothetical protein
MRVPVGGTSLAKGEIAMDTGSKTIGRMSSRVRSMRDAKRVDRLDEENDRLRTELRMTRSQLDRERERQHDVLDALNRASERKTKVTAKLRGGLLRLVIVGGAAYVFGSKAGRERYEQIRAWASSMKYRMKGQADEVDTSAPGMGPKPNPLTESGIRPGSEVGSNGPRSV